MPAGIRTALPLSHSSFFFFALAARAAGGRKSLPLIHFFFAVAVRAAGVRKSLPLIPVFSRSPFERQASANHFTISLFFVIGYLKDAAA